ncbi:MAG: hypothetical protein IKN15_05425 [Bacteroidaceae bacterium]|nr:hypothetical protein [Bacteroidaceae bacterium]
MNIFFSITNVAFIHVYKFQAKATNKDDALKELFKYNRQTLLKTAEYPGDKNIRRVIATENDELTEAESSWLHVSSLRWDVDRPASAIFDSYREGYPDYLFEQS